MNIFIVIANELVFSSISMQNLSLDIDALDATLESEKELSDVQARLKAEIARREALQGDYVTVLRANATLCRKIQEDEDAMRSSSRDGREKR